MLRTEDLTVRFGGLTALNRVNFEVGKGEIRAIIGPNGAGKSTFFNCLTGVIRPTAGRVLFNGENIAGLPPNRISQKGIARSYQITNILPNATTLENVRIAAQSRRHAWSMLTHHGDFHDILDKAHAVLESVGLDAKADELAANLSHGEQRNLEIGIALATEPQLLCLDEPTAGMSAAETHDTMALVRRIAKNLTILIVEHDMQVVMELASRITVLHYGEILAEGTPAEIQQNPQRAGGVSQDMTRLSLRPEPLVVGRRRPHLLRQEPYPARRLLGRRARARSSVCWAVTASARAPRSRPSWAWSAEPGPECCSRAEPITGMPAHKLARLGIGYVPRTAASSSC